MPEVIRLVSCCACLVAFLPDVGTYMVLPIQWYSVWLLVLVVAGDEPNPRSTAATPPSVTPSVTIVSPVPVACNTTTIHTTNVTTVATSTIVDPGASVSMVASCIAASLQTNSLVLGTVSVCSTGLPELSTDASVPPVSDSALAASTNGTILVIYC